MVMLSYISVMSATKQPTTRQFPNESQPRIPARSEPVEFTTPHSPAGDMYPKPSMTPAAPTTNMAPVPAHDRGAAPTRTRPRTQRQKPRNSPTSADMVHEHHVITTNALPNPPSVFIPTKQGNASRTRLQQSVKNYQFPSTLADTQAEESVHVHHSFTTHVQQDTRKDVPDQPTPSGTRPLLPHHPAQLAGQVVPNN